MSCACCGLASGTFCTLSTLILGTNWKNRSDQLTLQLRTLLRKVMHLSRSHDNEIPTLASVSIGIGISLYSQPLSLARNKYSRNSMGFTAGSVVKNLSAKQETWIQSLRRSPGEGDGNPLQYSCLGDVMYRAAWRAPVHGA